MAENKETHHYYNFLEEFDVLCRKYDLSIGHEDGHGAFIIEDYDEHNIEWMKSSIDLKLEQ